jgi:hypothetical protein
MYSSQLTPRTRRELLENYCNLPPKTALKLLENYCSSIVASLRNTRRSLDPSQLSRHPSVYNCCLTTSEARRCEAIRGDAELGSARRKHRFVYCCVFAGTCFEVTVPAWRKYAIVFYRGWYISVEHISSIFRAENDGAVSSFKTVGTCQTTLCYNPTWKASKVI